MEIIETDLDYIQGLVKTLPELGINISQINDQGIGLLTSILRDLAIANGPMFVIVALKTALEAYVEHQDRYQEYHKIFKDLTTIVQL